MRSDTNGPGGTSRPGSKSLMSMYMLAALCFIVAAWTRDAMHPVGFFLEYAVYL